MATWVMKQGDVLPALRATLLQGNQPLDLGGTTVRLHMRVFGGTALKINGACTLVDAPNGVVQYAWVAGDTDTPGDYEAEFEITYAGNATLTCPTNDYILVSIVPSVG